MTESDTTNEDRELLERFSELDSSKLTGEQLDRLLIVTQTENLIAKARLMEVKARWRPLLILTVLLWLVVFVGRVVPG